MQASHIEHGADFSGIRYAQCWEDADVLLAASGAAAGDTCLSIASAGDNTLALAGAGAGRVIAVDLSAAQIACLDLRIAAFRTLNHGELLELLGVTLSQRRLYLYRRCRPALPAAARAFWDRHSNLIERGVVTQGKFERYLSTFRKVVLPLLQPRSRIELLFELQTVGERRAFFDRYWDTRRLEWLGSTFFGGPLLGRFGRDPSFTRFADEPVWRNLRRRIPEALVYQSPADNPYLQWILTGRFVSALPWALRPENFARIRDNVSRIERHQASIESLLGRLPDDCLDACNLSDIFEYVPAAAYRRMLEQLVRVGAPGCRLVYWNLVTERHRPWSMTDRLAELGDLAERLHGLDKAFFYRRLVVEEVLQ